ncbi:MAG: hypothetical protein ACI4XD_00560 [Clostridia bacterium]
MNKITQIYENYLNVVFHPIDAKRIEKSISKTVQYLKHIYEYVKVKKYNKIIISIENLNDINALEKIKDEGYDNVVVTEYALDYIEGNDFISKMVNYIRYSIMLGDKKTKILFKKH